MKMLMLLFIVVLFTVGDVTSVTDEEFQELKDLLNHQIIRNDQQDQVIFDQAVEITQLKQALGFFPADVHKKIVPMENSHSKDDPEIFQNITLEERVSLLEIQIIEVQDDIDGIEEDIDGVEQNVDFLEDEQFLQDQRIYDLEQETNELEDNIDLVNQDVLDLQATTLTLDYRVTSLEENGGGNANITQLETRVTELEILTVDQGISIDINEEDIQGLQSSDAALEARVTALEENNGGGGSSNETSIAFFAVYPDGTIPFDTNVLFSEVLVNDEEGYNPSTGTFTVPPGGDGLYYFSTYLLVYYNEIGYFNIQVNGVILCTADGYGLNGGDNQQATCSGLAQLTEGDEVSLVYDDGSDTSPLGRNSDLHFNGFSGFRL